MRRPNQSTIPEFKQKPGLRFQPEVYQRLQRGINVMVDAIRPTLGPLPRSVAIQPVMQNKTPELLDHGAIIARRIIDLPHPGDNVGAMYTRAMLWRLNEQVGDGTATAAVLFQHIFNAGVRYISAGGNAMLLRAALEKGMFAILEELSHMAQPLEGKEMLARVAHSVCPDSSLAATLAEIFHMIGEYGGLDIRSGRGREIEREYIAGNYWTGGLASSHLIADPSEKKTQMFDAAILISDLEIQQAQDLMPVLKAAVQAGVQGLFIVARSFSDQAISLLVSSLKSEKMKLIGVKTPGLRSDDQMYALQDLAALTGGKPFFKAAGETFTSVRPEDFGRARHIWADMNFLGLAGGRGNPRTLREHVDRLRQALEHCEEEDLRKRMLERMGRLMGGAAILHVGGMTEAEITARKELATRAAQALRGALREGVLSGGGAALLACRPRLRSMLASSNSPEERAAWQILIDALQIPFCAILENAGQDPGSVLAQFDGNRSNQMFDVLQQKVVDAADTGVLDCAAVLKAVVHSAVRSAALALTIDVFVHRRKPPLTTDPD